MSYSFSGVDFYINTNGNDLNAGTTAADGGGSDSATYTSTAGNFDGTSVFTPTDGSTPASTVSAGMWGNFYNTGDAQPRCLAKILSVAAGVNGAITLDTSFKIGTVPTSNSGSRAIKVGGAWASLIAPCSTLIGAVTSPVTMRINCKAATYANTTNTRACTIGGAAGIIIWFRGYKTTPGDLDTMPASSIANWTLGTDVPYFTFTTGSFKLSGKDASISTLAVTSASTGSTGSFQISAVNCRIHHCDIRNSASSSGAYAVQSGSTGMSISESFLQAVTGTGVIVISSVSFASVLGCYIKGGVASIGGTSSTAVIVSNIFDSPSGDAISPTTSFNCVISNNVFYAPSGHAINILPTTAMAIIGNIFHTVNQSSKYPVNYGGASDIGLVYIAGNSVYNCTAGNSPNGLAQNLGDIPDFDTIIEATDPFPSAASHLFVYAGTTGQGNGFPSYFFDNADTAKFLSNRDPGATNHVASGGAGMLYIPSMEGI